VLADTKIHLLGSFQNIRVARDAICNLILGSPPGKVRGARLCRAPCAAASFACAQRAATHRLQLPAAGSCQGRRPACI
jgi:rRNA processing protein Krr1/Pno1